MRDLSWFTNSDDERPRAETSKITILVLTSPALRQRFFETIVIYNVVVYPIGFWLWVKRILSFRELFHRLRAGLTIDSHLLTQARRRLIHLPWFGAAIGAAAWFLCIPVFLGALLQVQHPLAPGLLWHLPISFCISGFIAITHTFFLVELASHWGLFPIFFQDVRADRLKGIRPISLRTRGMMWAISTGICPISSLLLLIFAPPSPGTNPQWFGLFVGAIGIAFGLCSAMLIGRSVAQPVNQLRAAAQAVTEGRLDVQVPLRRADEFGALIGEFNRMITGLREKERLRRTFGVHVGRKVAEQILAREQPILGILVLVLWAGARRLPIRVARHDQANEVPHVPIVR